jgi:uncharacterized protein
MSQIIVYGAGGKAGRAAVVEASGRGHQVTAVMRDPAKYADLVAADDVRIVTGDVTDASSVAYLSKGHDAAISAVYDAAAQPEAFFADASRALIDGLTQAGVSRLVSTGLASVLETASGALLMDTPNYPQDYRAFYLGHAAGTNVLRTTTAGCDWLVLSPAGDFDHDGARTGRYWIAPAEATSRISYADFAIALLDEIDNPQHQSVHLGVEAG